MVFSFILAKNIIEFSIGSIGKSSKVPNREKLNNYNPKLLYKKELKVYMKFFFIL